MLHSLKHGSDGMEPAGRSKDLIWNVLTITLVLGILLVGVIILVIFAALNSVLSLGYYAPLVNRLYRGQPSQTVQEGGKISPWMAAPMVILALAIVLFGVWPSLLTNLTSRAALGLFMLMGG